MKKILIISFSFVTTAVLAQVPGTEEWYQKNGSHVPAQPSCVVDEAHNQGPEQDVSVAPEMRTKKPTQGIVPNNSKDLCVWVQDYNNGDAVIVGSNVPALQQNHRINPDLVSHYSLELIDGEWVLVNDENASNIPVTVVRLNRK